MSVFSCCCWNSKATYHADSSGTEELNKETEFLVNARKDDNDVVIVGYKRRPESKPTPCTTTTMATLAPTEADEKFIDSVKKRQAASMAIANEIEQSLAAAISDRATDEVLEALTRYRRGLGIADSPSVMLDEPQTPDIVRSRSSHDSDGMILRPGRGSVLPKLGLESPTATPHFTNKQRRSIIRVRPQSVVENLSLGHIPDLLESPSSHRSGSQMSASVRNGGGGSNAGLLGNDLAHNNNNHGSMMDDVGGDEGCDSITELPSASFQLQHLVKGRPKRAKTRAPTRPLVNVEGGGTKEIGEGLEQFFRPGSVTPTTLTPLVSPTSEECSSLSFVDSPTMSRDGNGHMTSEETTPILEERRVVKLERSSPLMKSASSSWATRSRSTDNLETYSPLVGRKSPLVKMHTEGGAAGDSAQQTAERFLKADAERDHKMRSPSTDSIKSHTGADSSSVIMKTGNGILRTPIVLQKPRPWSVVGNDSAKSGAHASESKTTPETLDDDVDIVPFGQGTGGSIVGITPGIAIAAGGSGGGSIVGITPGAALEKKSVRELAAGLNRMEIPMKPQVLPRSLLTSSNKTQSLTSPTATAATSATSTTSTAMTTSLNSNNLSSSSTTSTTMNNSVLVTVTNTMSSSMSENSSSMSSSVVTESSSSSSSTGSTVTKTAESILQQHRLRINSNSSTNSANAAAIKNEINELLSKNRVSDSSRRNSNGSNNSANFIGNEILNIKNGGSSSSNGGGPAVFKRIAGKEISAMFEEKLVEGLQRSSTRRTFKETPYTKEDVVDL